MKGGVKIKAPPSIKRTTKTVSTKLSSTGKRVSVKSASLGTRISVDTLIKRVRANQKATSIKTAQIQKSALQYQTRKVQKDQRAIQSDVKADQRAQAKADLAKLDLFTVKEVPFTKRTSYTRAQKAEYAATRLKELEAKANQRALDITKSIEEGVTSRITTTANVAKGRILNRVRDIRMARMMKVFQSLRDNAQITIHDKSGKHATGIQRLGRRTKALNTKRGEFDIVASRTDTTAHNVDAIKGLIKDNDALFTSVKAQWDQSVSDAVIARSDSRAAAIEVETFKTGIDITTPSLKGAVREAGQLRGHLISLQTSTSSLKGVIKTVDPPAVKKNGTDAEGAADGAKTQAELEGAEIVKIDAEAKVHKGLQELAEGNVKTLGDAKADAVITFKETLGGIKEGADAEVVRLGGERDTANTAREAADADNTIKSDRNDLITEQLGSKRGDLSEQLTAVETARSKEGTAKANKDLDAGSRDRDLTHLEGLVEKVEGTRTDMDTAEGTAKDAYPSMDSSHGPNKGRQEEINTKDLPEVEGEGTKATGRRGLFETVLTFLRGLGGKNKTDLETNQTDTKTGLDTDGDLKGQKTAKEGEIKGGKDARNSLSTFRGEKGGRFRLLSVKRDIANFLHGARNKILGKRVGDTDIDTLGITERGAAYDKLITNLRDTSSVTMRSSLLKHLGGLLKLGKRGKALRQKGIDLDTVTGRLADTNQKIADLRGQKGIEDTNLSRVEGLRDGQIAVRDNASKVVTDAEGRIVKERENLGGRLGSIKDALGAIRKLRGKAADVDAALVKNRDNQEAASTGKFNTRSAEMDVEAGTLRSKADLEGEYAKQAEANSKQFEQLEEAAIGRVKDLEEGKGDAVSQRDVQLQQRLADVEGFVTSSRSSLDFADGAGKAADANVKEGGGYRDTVVRELDGVRGKIGVKEGDVTRAREAEVTARDKMDTDSFARGAQEAHLGRLGGEVNPKRTDMDNSRDAANDALPIEDPTKAGRESRMQVIRETDIPTARQEGEGAGTRKAGHETLLRTDLEVKVETNQKGLGDLESSRGEVVKNLGDDGTKKGELETIRDTQTSLRDGVTGLRGGAWGRFKAFSSKKSVSGAIYDSRKGLMEKAPKIPDDIDITLGQKDRGDLFDTQLGIKRGLSKFSLFSSVKKFRSKVIRLGKVEGAIRGVDANFKRTGAEIEATTQRIQEYKASIGREGGQKTAIEDAATKARKASDAAKVEAGKAEGSAKADGGRVDAEIGGIRSDIIKSGGIRGKLASLGKLTSVLRGKINDVDPASAKQKGVDAEGDAVKAKEAADAEGGNIKKVELEEGSFRGEQDAAAGRVKGLEEAKGAAAKVHQETIKTTLENVETGVTRTGQEVDTAATARGLAEADVGVKGGRVDTLRLELEGQRIDISNKHGDVDAARVREEAAKDAADLDAGAVRAHEQNLNGLQRAEPTTRGASEKADLLADSLKPEVDPNLEGYKGRQREIEGDIDGLIGGKVESEENLKGARDLLDGLNGKRDMNDGSLSTNTKADGDISTKLADDLVKQGDYDAKVRQLREGLEVVEGIHRLANGRFREGYSRMAASDIIYNARAGLLRNKLKIDYKFDTLGLKDRVTKGDYVFGGQRSLTQTRLLELSAKRGLVNNRFDVRNRAADIIRTRVGKNGVDIDTTRTNIDRLRGDIDYHVRLRRGREDAGADARGRRTKGLKDAADAEGAAIKNREDIDATTKKIRDAIETRNKAADVNTKIGQKLDGISKTKVEIDAASLKQKGVDAEVAANKAKDAAEAEGVAVKRETDAADKFDSESKGADARKVELEGKKLDAMKEHKIKSADLDVASTKNKMDDADLAKKDAGTKVDEADARVKTLKEDLEAGQKAIRDKEVDVDAAAKAEADARTKMDLDADAKARQEADLKKKNDDADDAAVKRDKAEEEADANKPNKDDLDALKKQQEDVKNKTEQESNSKTDLEEANQKRRQNKNDLEAEGKKNKNELDENGKKKNDLDEDADAAAKRKKDLEDDIQKKKKDKDDADAKKKKAMDLVKKLLGLLSSLLGLLMSLFGMGALMCLVAGICPATLPSGDDIPPDCDGDECDIDDTYEPLDEYGEKDVLDVDNYEAGYKAGRAKGRLDGLVEGAKDGEDTIYTMFGVDVKEYQDEAALLAAVRAINKEMLAQLDELKATIPGINREEFCNLMNAQLVEDNMNVDEMYPECVGVGAGQEGGRRAKQRGGALMEDCEDDENKTPYDMGYCTGYNETFPLYFSSGTELGKKKAVGFLVSSGVFSQVDKREEGTYYILGEVDEAAEAAAAGTYYILNEVPMKGGSGSGQSMLQQAVAAFKQYKSRGRTFSKTKHLLNKIKEKTIFAQGQN